MVTNGDSRNKQTNKQNAQSILNDLELIDLPNNA